MKKLLLLILPVLFISCTGTFHLTNPPTGTTYSNTLYYNPYHTVTHISPFYINRYSYYNPYYQYPYYKIKKEPLIHYHHDHKKPSNTYYGHRKK